MKYVFLSLGILIGSILYGLTPTANAFGECDQYGVMAQYNYDGTCSCISGWVFQNTILGKQCVSMSQYCKDKYGIMATSTISSDGCTCMAGYVFGTDLLGNKSCVNADGLCRDQLGNHASYNSLSDKCECDYGYYIENGECTSTDDICSGKFGYNSQYNILTDSCECKSGYVLSQKEFGSGLECRSCTDKHGIHAEYNGLTKECECEDGYTPDDDNQCIEKQNNVYFDVIELDDENDEVVIRSDYDGSYYHVSYGIGCLSFWRYEDKQIVVNLGTDYSLDTWDTIVLQDHDQTCNIVTKEKVYSDFSLSEDEEESGGYYIPVSGDTFEADIASSPYQQAISNLKAKGVIGGYPDGTYKPKNPINRAEFIKIVMGAIGTPASGANCYSDVKDEWFAGYACAAKQQEIATGYPDGSFKPISNINVAEALKIVLEAFVIPVRSLDEGEEWFKPYIEASQSHSLYLPTFDSADKRITREDVAELVSRILNLQNDLAS